MFDLNLKSQAIMTNHYQLLCFEMLLVLWLQAKDVMLKDVERH